MRLLLPALLVSVLSASADAAFVSSEYGVSVTAPAGWRQISYPGVLVAYASPAATARFAPNLNVTVEAVPKGLTLPQYVTAGQATLKRAITDYKPLGSRNTTLGGQPAYQQMFSGRQGEFSLYFVQTIALRSGRAYVLTGTTLLAQKATMAAPMTSFANSLKFTR